ncbi:hypothetical protein PTKIN_Ptkin08bG0093100 [Pterospermum kingtungense]
MVKVFKDNVLIRQLLESRGEGKVLIVDGGERTRCALLGGNLVESAHTVRWAGIIVNGCIRDMDEINACDIGVRALGANPLKSNKKAIGDKHIPVRIARTLIHAGEWPYAVSDGIPCKIVNLSVHCVFYHNYENGKKKALQLESNDVVMLTSMLLGCSHLKLLEIRKQLQIRNHSSPSGNASQRKAHYLSKALEASLAGTGSEEYADLTSNTILNADIEA